MKSFQRHVLVVAIGFLGMNIAHAQLTIEQLIEQTGIEAGDVAMRDMPGWHKPRKIIFLDRFGFFEEVEDSMLGVELVVVRSEADAIAQAEDADAIIGSCAGRVVSAAPKVIWVQIFSAGAERCLVVDQIRSEQVILTNMQKMSSPVIAEHVIAMTLALARGLPQFSKTMPQGKWLRGSGVTDGMQTIAGKTMLVVGLGGIGTEVARRAAALDMRVIGTRRSSREGPEFVDYVGLSDELHELAGQADFIVNALPLTPATTGLFDQNFFAAAKSGTHFINVGRGGTVVTDDLVAALRDGRVAGAALDVTDPEPLPADHPLWQFDNVIITPHVASRGADRVRQRILAIENLRRFVAGDALLNVVDPNLGY